MKTLAQLLGLSRDTADVALHHARDEMGAIISGEAFGLRAIINKAKVKLEKIKADNRIMTRLDEFKQP